MRVIPVLETILVDESDVEQQEGQERIWGVVVAHGTRVGSDIA
jgi:hypothetical protein